ncbi:unnamed protein product [Trifolium pratense]|uniref:Uncharacterized protein n=1 Tax=Trifolium pratense TaxID=57577 RepID=A0ACB0KR32_TRIPR|nr:unnamed protein product [Trifolium pratense]
MWTDIVRPDEETNVYTLTGLTLGGLQTEEVFPCMFTMDCPSTFTCPPKFIPKCINLKCLCHLDKEPKEDF